MTRKKAAKKRPTSELRLASAEASPELDAVLARFRLLAALRRGWLEKLWSEEEAPSPRTVISHGEIEANLADRDSPQAESLWLEEDKTARGYSAALEKIEASIANNQSSRLAELVRVFGLNKEETDLLQACLAVALDPSLGRVCAYLQDHTGRAYVTEDLAARLFRYGRSSVWSAESALFRWDGSAKEMGAGEPRALTCDPYIRDWMTGKSTLDHLLVGVARLYEPKAPLYSWPVKESVDFVNQTIHAESPERLRFTIIGARGSGRRTLAATISAALGLPLLVIDADQVDEQTWPRLFLRAQRQAYLERRSVAWIGESLAKRSWPAMPAFPLQFVICEGGHEPPPFRSWLNEPSKCPRWASPSASNCGVSIFPLQRNGPMTSWTHWRERIACMWATSPMLPGRASIPPRQPLTRFGYQPITPG